MCHHTTTYVVASYYCICNRNDGLILPHDYTCIQSADLTRLFLIPRIVFCSSQLRACSADSTRISGSCGAIEEAGAMWHVERASNHDDYVFGQPRAILSGEGPCADPASDASGQAPWRACHFYRGSILTHQTKATLSLSHLDTHTIILDGEIDGKEEMV